MGWTRDKGAGSRATAAFVPLGGELGDACGTLEFAPHNQSLEESSLSNRSIAPLEMPRLVAGVLLGKTSPNSLYGLKGGHPRIATRFRFSDSAGFAACDSAERIKLLFCVSLTPASGHPAGWLRGGGF
jgi:hypothetical protein